MINRVPAYIITGFLGSGKTTTVQKLIEHFKRSGLKPALVLNEIGETNVEKDLFTGDHVLEMLNGCICCSIQGDFTNELHSFLTNLNNEEVPDVLLIEGTGIANPIEIVDALTDPLLIDSIDLYSVINLIDASKYLEYQSIFSSSKEVREVLKSQVTTSTYILLNKIDLVNEKVAEKVLTKINKLKQANTPVIQASFGDVDIDQLLEKRMTIKRSNGVLNLITAPTCGCSENHTCDEHVKEHHHHQHSFSAIKINIHDPIDRVQLQSWLNTLPKTIVRAKGIVQLTETVGYFQIQYASNVMQINRIKSQPATDPCLIIIGMNLDGVAIEHSFLKYFNK